MKAGVQAARDKLVELLKSHKLTAGMYVRVQGDDRDQSAMPSVRLYHDGREGYHSIAHRDACSFVVEPAPWSS